MRLLNVLGTSRIIHPLHGTRIGIERIDERSHEGPDTGGEVDRSVADDGSPAGRPSRNEPPIANGLSRCGPTSETPSQLAVFGADTIEKAIVATEINTAVPADGRQPDRAVSEERPKCFP